MDNAKLYRTLLSNVLTAKLENAGHSFSLDLRYMRVLSRNAQHFPFNLQRVITVPVISDIASDSLNTPLLIRRLNWLWTKDLALYKSKSHTHCLLFAVILPPMLLHPTLTPRARLLILSPPIGSTEPLPRGPV